MPELITAPVPGAGEPSMDDLRKMIETGPKEPETTTTSETSLEDKTQKAAPETAETKQPEEVEEELPKGVQKRIAKEVAQQAEYDRLINEARSTTKAKGAELAKLSGNSGSEPAQTTAPGSNARPQRPDLSTFPGNLAEYNAKLAEYEGLYETWVQDQTKQTVTKEFQDRQQRESTQKAWDAATTEHGADFPQLMDALGKSTPAEFQVAVSALEDWPRVAVHLAKNETERAALVEKFKASPLSAIAALGKLEARLKPAATTAAEDTPLPKPLKAVAGGPAGTTAAIDLDKADMATFSREIERRTKRK